MIVDPEPGTPPDAPLPHALPSSTAGTGTTRALTFPELFGLPTVLDLTTAARAIGVSVNTAYKLVKQGGFPCTVLRPGYRYRVPTASLMKAIGVEHMPVYLDDVEHGAVFAGRLG